MKRLWRALPIGLTLLALAACSATPPRSYEALSYDYLPQLRLNVAAIDIEDQSGRAAGNDVSSQAPTPPAAALRQMARDRLRAFGNAGRAVLVIRQASLVRTGDRIAGRMNVQLDIYASDNKRAAFATAEVTQNRTGDVDDLRATLYDITKLMMDKMNVELEFQARRSLKDWLLKAPSAAPAPVLQENLVAPGV